MQMFADSLFSIWSTVVWVCSQFVLPIFIGIYLFHVLFFLSDAVDTKKKCDVTAVDGIIPISDKSENGLKFTKWLK